MNPADGDLLVTRSQHMGERVRDEILEAYDHPQAEVGS